MFADRNTRWPLAAGALILTSAAFLPFLGCGASDDPWPADRRGPKIVVSFAPIYCFAANVAGDDAVVKSLMSTSGPHEFNPTDVEARLLRKADLLFINGLGLDEEMAKALKKGSGNRNMKVIELGERIPDEKLLGSAGHHDHGDGHKHDHGEGGHDPHVWLSPEQAAVMVEGIRDELKAADSGHAADYDRRATEYVAKLRDLKAQGLALLNDKKDRKLVTFHESLSYFARDFNLAIEGVVEKKPGVEPNSDEMNALIKLCVEKKVRLIAVEPQYTSNTSAKAILDELKRKGIADAELVEIDPLETVTPTALTADWYTRRMQDNLKALADRMK